MANPNITATAISIDTGSISLLVDQAVENSITSAIATLGTDPAWLEKIEGMINKAVVHRTLSTLSSIDINDIIQQRVDENIEKFKVEMLENFASTGIDDKATTCQLTIMDDATVIENTLTARSANFVESVVVRDLAVTGSINTDNRSWDTLASAISNKTLEKLEQEWKDKLVQQVSDEISSNGIKFDTVKIADDLLVLNGTLSKGITHSNLQKVGKLQDLTVTGETSLNETVVVLKKRLGINTEQPDSALNIWDEEVSISAGKYKNHEAYIGTSRNQALNIGVNKNPQISIGTDGITSIGKLRVAQYMIGHATSVPGHEGTKGDIVFNVDPLPGSAFAWVCLGGYKWKVLKAVE